MHPIVAGDILITTAGTGAAHDLGLAPLQEVTKRVKMKTSKRTRVRKKIRMTREMRDLVAEEDLVAGVAIDDHPGLTGVVVVLRGQGETIMKTIQVVKAPKKNESQEMRMEKRTKDHPVDADVDLVQGDPVHQKEIEEMKIQSRTSKKNTEMDRLTALLMIVKDHNVHT